MENKENIYRSTKIPLPVAPLPALPRHLLTENKLKSNGERHPLQTLQRQSLNSEQAGPSKRKVVKPKLGLNVDSRYVTVRRNTDNLDWDYKVFDESNKDADISIISISDDEECSDANNGIKLMCFTNNVYKNSLGEQRAAVTPIVKSAHLEQPSRVRNFKRSLRRPHSRELQGLSPVAKHEKKFEDTAKRRLQFIDRSHGKVRGTDAVMRSYMTCLNRDYSKDMFNYLLSIEKKPIDMPKMSRITRACVINWLIKINGSEGNPAVVQSACWYLDSLLGTSLIQVDKLQLVAAACYWIAQKQQGPVFSGKRLVTLADNAFTLERLLCAERAVIQRLKFPNNPIVPQDFITYFAWWCNNDDPAEIEHASTFLCMSGLIVDKALCDEFPSSIAATSVRNALILMRKKDLMVKLQMCPVYIAAEKKTLNMAHTCAILRRAVRTIASPIYEYKTLLEHYGCPPMYTAQAIVSAVSQFSVLDTRDSKN